MQSNGFQMKLVIGIDSCDNVPAKYDKVGRGQGDILVGRGMEGKN